MTPVQECVNMGIALSCVGMKSKTWKRVMSFSDCKAESHKSQSMKEYCEGEFYSRGHRILATDIQKTVKNWKDMFEYIDLFVPGASEVANYGVHDKDRHEKLKATNDTDAMKYQSTIWQVDQAIIPATLKLYMQRRYPDKCFPDLFQLHTWERGIDNRIDVGGEHSYKKFSEINFTDEVYQDIHVPKDAYLDIRWKHLMKYFLRLFDNEEILKIESYRQFFLSKLSAVNIDENYLKEI